MAQFNSHSGNGPTRAKAHGGRRGGFSLIELVIVVVIIGIIAAIAIPRMSRGSAGAADSALAQNLALIRNAMDMYQTEHNGVYPNGADGTAVAAQLLQFTDINGANPSTTKNPATGSIYGPYLRTIPALTVGANKGKNNIAVSTDANLPTGTATDGWLYSNVTGTVKANATGVDSGGVRDYGSY